MDAMDLQIFLVLLEDGIANGAIYALLAVTMVLVFTTTRYGSGDLLAVPALTKDGRRISVEFTIAVLRGADGEVAAIAAFLRDVTSRFEEMRRLKRQVAELTPST